MVNKKTESEIAIMREGGKILSEILTKLSAAVRPGITTAALDKLARELVSLHDAKASFLHYNGFPASICISINEEVVHGAPSERVLKEGDVVKLDFGVLYKGFHTDSARTVVVGKGDPGKLKLLAVTERSLELGIKAARIGNTLGDIGHAIQEYVESEGFNVVRDLVGHGIGRNLHEEPEVLNYGEAGEGQKLEAGMVIAIEPMVVEGSYDVVQDGFVYVTKDKKLAAHVEHTVAVTAKGPEILTQ